jgi:cardiolipin synthase A/B
MHKYSTGNSVTLLRNGAEYFPALASAIERAETTVYLEAYIFADDASGRLVADAMVHASKRGVDVRMVIDGFGTKPYLTPELSDYLIRAGVILLLYRADVWSMRLRRDRLRRLHRKIVVVDGRTAFIGGINVIDDMNTPGHVPPRIDFAVRVEGPMLNAIAAAAHRLWRVMRVVSIDRRKLPELQLVALVEPRGNTTAKFLVRDNFRYRRHIETAYLAAIRVSKSDITIASAYFFPGVRFRRELIEAAERGVRVTLILQARVEYRLLHHAAKALYGQLLAGGVRIVEFERSFLHAKVGVIDGRWATVGSSNIDPFSLLLAREANVVVRDAAFARELLDELEALERDGGQVVDPNRWAQRSWVSRTLDWAAYGLSRALIGLAGVRGPRW